jgi:hypothetical protein
LRKSSPTASGSANAGERSDRKPSKLRRCPIKKTRENPGTFTAQLRVVQVQIKEFASDSYSLPIGTQASGMAGTNREPYRLRAEPSRAPAKGVVRRRMTVNVSITRLNRRAKRLLHSNSGVIGASCLSIIGMIEPGRTVRLYRQIH